MFLVRHSFCAHMYVLPTRVAWVIGDKSVASRCVTIVGRWALVFHSDSRARCAAHPVGRTCWALNQWRPDKPTSINGHRGHSLTTRPHTDQTVLRRSTDGRSTYGQSVSMLSCGRRACHANNISPSVFSRRRPDTRRPAHSINCVYQLSLWPSAGCCCWPSSSHTTDVQSTSIHVILSSVI